MKWAQMIGVGDHAVIGTAAAQEWKATVEATRPGWTVKAYPRPVKVGGRDIPVVVLVFRAAKPEQAAQGLEGMEWINADGTINGQKHAGEAIEDVAESDPGYLRWVLSLEDLRDDDREIIELCLKRKV